MNLYESIQRNLGEKEESYDDYLQRKLEYTDALSNYLNKYQLRCEYLDPKDGNTFRSDCICGINIIDIPSNGCISYDNSTIPFNSISQAQEYIKDNADLIADDIVEYQYTRARDTYDQLSPFRSKRTKAQQTRGKQIERTLLDFVKYAKRELLNRRKSS